MAHALGPWTGVYHPGYALNIYAGGNPGSPIRTVNLRSVTSIQTSKSLNDISGTFSITLKDRGAQTHVKPMDVVTIRLKGHNQGWAKVLVGVVSTVEPSGSAQLTSSEADVTISGSCTGKYLQINSMFLPVWDPSADLPTALTFGVGAVPGGLGASVPNQIYPRTIFGYIFDHYVTGRRNYVGESGTPNARFWMNRKNRFEWVTNASGKPFEVPFIQFDEDTCDTALTNLCVQGFTEGWVDEVGNIVYRRPAWDAPVSWNLSTGGLLNWDLSSADDAMATYVEVYPGANPGVPSAQAQAMLAGRAPIPSDYVVGLQKSGYRTPASPAFIIDTDSTGKVTAAGARNWYYQKQKKYGVRPYQITSPLLASRDQAQAQAEGLLRFMLRWDKSGTVTIPGEPNVRLGQTVYLHGKLEDKQIARTYYVEGVSHEYVEGDHYSTTLTLTHGRDPGDPSYASMVLPNFSAAQLVNSSGVLSAGSSSGKLAPGSGGSGSPQNDGGALVAVTPGVYVNPFAKATGMIFQQIDMGVDLDFDIGSPIIAPGDLRVLGVTQNWYKGQPYVAYQFINGPAKGRNWYLAEGIVPAVTTGIVKAGHVIATYKDQAQTGIETGWAATPDWTSTLAQATTGHPSDNGPTPAGISFARFLQACGVPLTDSQIGG